MSKLKRAASAALATCLVLLAGCSGAGSGAISTPSLAGTSAVPSGSGDATPAATDLSSYKYSKTGSVVEVTFWTAAVEEINQQLVDKFNETTGKDQNIHVTAQYQGDYWEMQQKINAASIAGTLPNAFIDEVSMTRGFADDDVILNLEPYMQANSFDNSAFQIGDLGNLYMGEDMYAFPHMRSVPVMYVNKTLAKSVGLSEAGPATFDELTTYLQACYDKTGQPPMYLFNYDFWVMEALLHSYSNTNILSDDEKSCNINSEGGVKLVTYLKGLVDKGLVKVLPITDMNAFYATIANPSTALWLTSIGGYKAFAPMASQYGIDLGVSMIPEGENGTRGVPVGGSNTYLANAGTDQQKAAAFIFMTWLSDTEQAAFASSQTGYLPTKLASLETSVMKETLAQFPGFQVAFDELQYCKMRPTTGSYHEVEDLMCEKINSILLDNLDIKSSLDTLAKDVNAILNR
ncbi:sn-glycerol 3-phosphate transport system substrate-binding protein [Sporobacter termitidis DSM 10068]|uniref:sn-glycerol 3-phosphate transport system substrate-binding protein n=1 Tax=Sporobacter termitidis DSM 10068 TaxID=1123282 RepID=A0A1M5VPZ9_9FIRM|nr:extracellular solute-binding protein [Sporobacter termitidis]SHH77315.1 sn-glycerol 3-phosphate transport system substrate-binding protein [Sporobacter termitidis DSM 10068]